MKSNVDHSTRTSVAAILLLGLVFICYANILNAPWYFDDLIRIVNNPAVHMSELTPSAVMASMDPAAGASHSRDAFFRPVAMLTFALNWYFTNGDVVGFHLVNILIHFLTTVVLYRTILALACTPQAARLSLGQARFVALLASALWAVHPIQTQAVTYVIQRTTSLAALFFISGIYAYLTGRLADSRGKRIAFFVLSAVCYLLAVGTKLNTAILPLSILLIDILFFQDLDSPGNRFKVFYRVALAGVVALVLGVGLLWYLKGNPLTSIIGAYQWRPFSLAERLMTEPRIVLYYLSQIVLPLPGRFAFMRDIPISRSWLEPAMTLSALVVLVLLIGVGIMAARRYKFLSLAILFFFLNHLVESSFLPLELMYEHRNYLPSMFLFAPLAILIAVGIERWRQSRRVLFGGLVAGTVLLLIMLGAATHMRNSLWASEKLFWEDVLVKAPGNARPYLQLAAYHEKQGNYDLALKLYARSLALYDPAPQRARAGAYNNMGTIFNRLNRKDAAIAHFQKALDVNPRHEIARYNLLFPLVASGRFDDALAHAEILLQKNPTHPYYLNSAGYILLLQGRLDSARRHLEKALVATPSATDVLINLGITMGRLGHYTEALALLSHARRLAPAQPTALMGLIEVHVRAGDATAADEYTDELVRRFPLDFYYPRFAGPSVGLTPYDADLIRPILAKHLRKFTVTNDQVRF
jgi:tetratricopeptide (TPR) repeat protein